MENIVIIFLRIFHILNLWKLKNTLNLFRFYKFSLKIMERNILEYFREFVQNIWYIIINTVLVLIEWTKLSRKSPVSHFAIFVIMR